MALLDPVVLCEQLTDEQDQVVHRPRALNSLPDRRSAGLPLRRTASYAVRDVRAACSRAWERFGAPQPPDVNVVALVGTPTGVRRGAHFHAAAECGVHFPSEARSHAPTVWRACFPAEHCLRAATARRVCAQFQAPPYAPAA
jgi:hypothetical protein